MRIFLIHAVKVAMAPIETAFQRHWDTVERVNLLDESLSVDQAAATTLTPEMHGRFSALGRHAVASGADAILFTCSAFGPAIEDVAAQLPIPVLKPNQAMFDHAISTGGQLGLLASFQPSLAPMVAEYRAMAGPNAPDLITHAVPQAMTALNAGDGETHDRLLAEAAAETMSDCDAILLAQFSTARAHDRVAAAVGKPVLTSPDSAVLDLKAQFSAA